MKLLTFKSLALILLLSVSCTTKNEPAMISKASGIDVSHHQGKVDWKQVSLTKDLGYVYLKASEGVTYTDPEYKNNLKSAKEAGLLVGAYHFYSEKSDIDSQFEHFKDLYPKGKADLIPMLDVEPRGKCSPERIAKIRKDVKRFQDLCRRYYGTEAMLYVEPMMTEKSWLGPIIGKDTRLCIGHPYETAPRIGSGVEYTIWQFTYTGRVKGIRGGVDMHRFHRNASMKDILLR